MAPQSRTPLEHGRPDVAFVLFDSDGLLIDTESIYTRVTSTIMSRYGMEYTWAVKAKLMGLPAQAAAETLVALTGLPMTPLDYLAERNAKQLVAFEATEKMPGALKVVSHLAKARVPISVASSSHSDMFAVKAKRNRDLFDFFGDHITLGNDPEVKHGKPAPDIYLLAARRLGVPEGDEDKCLVFEDAPAGVEAGLAAGMRVVWVPDMNLDLDENLVSDPRVTIIRSLEDFSPEAFGLPPYGND